MNMLSMQADRAEDMASRLEGALYYMQGAIEELEGEDDDFCSDLVSGLEELITTAKSEKRNYDEVLAEADRRELAAMNREYERSVL